MSDPVAYELPSGQVALSGPVEKPAPGTLPLRGDVAHIALATRYLVPHYVIPQQRVIGAGGASMTLNSAPDSEVVADLAPGSTVEALDFAGEWCWCCIGPEGPTGYIPIAALAER